MKEASHSFLRTEATGRLQGKSAKGHWSPLAQQGGKESGGEKEGRQQERRDRHGRKEKEGRKRCWLGKSFGDKRGHLRRAAGDFGHSQSTNGG